MAAAEGASGRGCTALGPHEPARPAAHGVGRLRRLPERPHVGPTSTGGADAVGPTEAGRRRPLVSGGGLAGGPGERGELGNSISWLVVGLGQ